MVSGVRKEGSEAFPNIGNFSKVCFLWADPSTWVTPVCSGGLLGHPKSGAIRRCGKTDNLIVLFQPNFNSTEK